jgi:predicted RNase H-like HicB family nuclease/predicted RNA binding protein YcfA (HicA-like mRNA interferase family)
MNRHKILQKILSGSKNIRFSDMVKLVQGFGFKLSRTDGSHHIFVKSGILELVNLQIEIGGQIMRNYHINIFYSEDEECYIADIPDLEACSAFGDTPNEALREVLRAKQLWLEAAKMEKKPIPQPKYRPVIYQALSA